MSTTFIKDADVQPVWFHADAEGEILGRLAVRIANTIMGKHKPSFTPNADDGDYVIVTNAAKIGATGRKEKDKLYRFHSGYVGGLKEIPLGEMRDRRPEEIIKLAVKRMLPKNRLGRQMLNKLKVYTSSTHPHAAQQPKPLP